MPYFNPHSLRNTLVCLGETLCQTPEAFKAWSQNLGHEQVLTTFTSYGDVPPRRQAEILQGLTHGSHTGTATSPSTESLAQELVQQMRQQGLIGPQGG